MKNKNFILIISALIIPFFIPYCVFLKEILPYALSIMLFFNFLNLDTGKTKFRKEFFYYPVFSLAFFCPLALFISRLCGIENFTGIILLAAAPAAVSSPVMADFIGADKTLSVMLAVISNLLAPLLYFTIWQTASSHSHSGTLYPNRQKKFRKNAHSLLFSSHVAYVMYNKNSAVLLCNIIDNGKTETESYFFNF